MRVIILAAVFVIPETEALTLYGKIRIIFSVWTKKSRTKSIFQKNDAAKVPEQERCTEWRRENSPSDL